MIKTDYRSRLFHDISIRIVKGINLVGMTAFFAAAWYSSYADQLWVKFFRRGHWLVIALFFILYLIIGRIYDAFKMSYNPISEMIYSQIISLFEVNTVMYIVAWLLIRHTPSPIPLILVFALQIVVSVIWSNFSQRWYFHTFPANKTIIIWDMRKSISNLIDKYELSKKYKVVANASADECLKDLTILDDADTVFLVGVHSHDRNEIVKHCLKHNVKAFVIPRVGDLIIAGARQSNMFHLLMLKVERYNPTFEYSVIKRLGDIVLSLFALVIFSPIIIITSLLIKIEDGGPIFYKQIRLTKDGKKFEIIKFRSMVTDAEKDGISRLSTGDSDSRVTKTGRIIRKYRIDEIPQFFNILQGDLSLVGPRAERPELACEYQKELPEFELRLQTKAGLTGYAQVYGKYNTSPYDKLLMDLMYIANASIFEDIRIIFSTIKILFMPESTEGIEEGQTTAMEMDNDNNARK